MIIAPYTQTDLTIERMRYGQDISAVKMQKVIRMPDEQQEGVIPLASGLHRDGTIHIYVKGADSGLSIGLEDDGTLWVRVDESKRAMRVSV